MTTIEQPTIEPAAPEAEPEYAIVEIFGHRRLAGRVSQVERYGTKMLRIDIPVKGDFVNGFVSQFYSGASIFAETPCDLATVMRENKPYEPAGRYLGAPDEDDDDDLPRL